MLLTRLVHCASAWAKKGLPGYCAFCLSPQQTSSGWCQECFAQLPWNAHGCWQCKEPLAVGGEASAQPVCGHCRERPPAFTAATAELLFEEPIRALVHDFKFNASPRAGMLLVELMMSKPPSSLGEGLLPVPMHSTRARKRGFNQSHWLAGQLGKRVKLPVVTAECSHQLPSQRTLSRKERAKNLIGAFHINGPLPSHLTIIDDVVTTGATCQALAEEALRAGAKRVDIWAVARTPLVHN
ncbi:ComF family protein [Vreelandella venusta]|uniref:ComF family protein n=3 Tax=Vreelandella venusta TaxID=44935 RepID=A0AAQ0CJE0_9GAMM|nr:ComF family protein [Halomonas venusta]